MFKVAVLSGKGGTGKTMVATGIVMSVPGAGYGDCDVEAPNGHLLLKPSIQNTERVFVPVPYIDGSRCNGCGACADFCAYNALICQADKDVHLFEELCHSCGGCVMVCPEDAMSEKKREVGEILTGIFGIASTIVYGRADIGEGRTTPVIDAVHNAMDKNGLWIVDCPPGTTCPAVVSAKGCDGAIIVAEPSLAGAHDLEATLQMLSILKIPAVMILNKAGLGSVNIEKICEPFDVRTVMEIPYDTEIAKAYASGELIHDVIPGIKEDFVRVVQILRDTVNRS